MREARRSGFRRELTDAERSPVRRCSRGARIREQERPPCRKRRSAGVADGSAAARYPRAVRGAYAMQPSGRISGLASAFLPANAGNRPNQEKREMRLRATRRLRLPKRQALDAAWPNAASSVEGCREGSATGIRSEERAVEERGSRPGVRAPAAGTGARSGGQRQGPRKESAKNGSRSRRTAKMVAAQAAFLLSRARAMRRRAQVARSSRRKGTSPVRADETRQPASRPRFRLHEPASGSRKTRRNEAPVPLSHFAGSSSAKPDALVLFALACEAVRQH